MTDVRSYSLAAEGDRQAAPHFKVREFACKDGSDPVFVSPRLVGCWRPSAPISARR